MNELLTQMESFPGIFCATTNLFENIDRAALRRFDLKAKFDFLRPEQRLGLLERHLAALGLGTDGVKRLVPRLSALPLNEDPPSAPSKVQRNSFAGSKTIRL